MTDVTKAPAAPAPIAAVVPGQIETASLPRIEGWRQSGAAVIGEVFNDERYEDGTPIWTTDIQEGELQPGNVIRTRNTTYLLGEHA